MFKKGIDAKALGEKLLNTAMYSSSIGEDDANVNIAISKGDNNEEN